MPGILRELDLRFERMVVGIGLGLAAPILPIVFWSTDSLIVTATIAMVDAMLLYGFVAFGFYSLRHHDDRRQVFARLERWRRSLAQSEAELGALRAQRGRRAEPLRRLEEELGALPARLEDELRAIKADLDLLLAGIAERRQLAGEQEAAELAQAQQRLAHRTTEAAGRRGALLQSEQRERDLLLEQLRQNFVGEHLRAALITSAALPGLEEAAARQLAARGVITAADVSALPATGVDAMTRQLLERWAQQVTAQARLSAPASVGPARAEALAARYGPQVQAIDEDIAAAVESHRHRQAEILASAQRYREQLAGEEREHRDDADFRTTVVRDRFGSEARRLATEVAAVKSQSDADIARLDAKLADLTQAAFSQRADLFQLQRQLARYGELTFKKYMRRILWLD